MRSKETTNMIYTTLKQEILSLAIRPGELKKEGDLCDRFKASRTPVHAALERLSEAGLIEFIPYKGVRATLLNFSDIYQNIMMRILLETKAVQDFSRTANPFAIERCMHVLRKQEILLENGPFVETAFYALDVELHQHWFEETGFPLFWQIIQEAEISYTRFRMLDIVEMHAFRDLVQEHRVLLLLIEQQKFEEIEQVITYHLFGGIRRMDAVLQTDLRMYFSDCNDIEKYLDKVRAIKKPQSLA
ncbi:GntR family transcriptional regulator [Sphaerochaeta halotolerans]|nr:GntR family transcriptional regulator [Sphaerochaeta halotolerans]MBG0767636.1 GntR family transcriptional regulator [Spirochaetaceae bacterium]MDK2859594.1 GntR family transcriptional regulator, rspAB operon transcriptional repressor [Sphaerochaeta sp.]MXI86296.1 GntR family transcriptional regulator [Sphaerochaeta halotolerans]